MSNSTLGGLSNPMSRGSNLSRERLLVDADRLFSINWLINRLLHEIHQSMTPEALAQSHRFFFRLRKKPELWFAWHMIKAHHASLAKIDEFRQLCPESGQLIEALNEEREEAIRAFMKFVASKRWDTLRDDDRSWRQYALMLYHMKDKNTQIEQEFFVQLDYICTMTDALCGRWDLLFPTGDNIATDSADHDSNTNLEAVEPRADFKTLLSGAWFNTYCVDTEKYNEKWRNKFVEDLLKSKHAPNMMMKWKERSVVEMLGIIGVLKEAGLFWENVSCLALAKAIRLSNLPQKKDKTLSKYMRDAHKLECYDWVKEYEGLFD